jgi:glycosyltransferase involved in cell wall biosynthesis
MKVALVHDYLWEYGGAERVLEVLHEMYPEAPVYTSFFFRDKMPEYFGNWDIRVSFLQSIPGHRFLRKVLIYLMPRAFEAFSLQEYDLVISSASFAAKGIISKPGATHICYCHTPPRFVWGLPSRMRRNRFLRIVLALPDWWLRLWDYAAAHRVTKFVANSRNVAARIKRFYGLESVVIYPPVELQGDLPDLVAEKDEYYLVVSRLAKLKNIDLIIRSCIRQKRKLKIVGVGEQQKYLKSISNSAIEFLGYVKDDRLKLLYAHARGLIIAQVDEDFGMTAVEAHWCGCPVLAYRGGGYTESVVEGVNGAFFEVLDEECLSTAIYRFEAINFEVQKVRESAMKFAKARFKSELLSLIQNVR